MFDPKRASHGLPVLVAHNVLEPIVQRGRHIAVVQLEEAMPHGRVASTKAQQEGPLHLVPDPLCMALQQQTNTQSTNAVIDIDLSAIVAESVSKHTGPASPCEKAGS